MFFSRISLPVVSCWPTQLSFTTYTSHACCISQQSHVCCHAFNIVVWKSLCLSIHRPTTSRSRYYDHTALYMLIISAANCCTVLIRIQLWKVCFHKYRKDTWALQHFGFTILVFPSVVKYNHRTKAINFK